MFHFTLFKSFIFLESQNSETKFKWYVSNGFEDSPFLILLDSVGNGNCQFSAISSQIEHVLKVKITAGEIRERIVEYLKQNPRTEDGIQFDQFCTGKFYGNWKTFLESMSKNGTYGDHLTLVAAANSFNVTIVVISSLGVQATTVIFPKLQGAHFLQNESNINKVLWIGLNADKHFGEACHYLSLKLPQDFNVLNFLAVVNS